MGKVLSNFTNGFTGAVSRSIDNIIVSMKNASAASIPFGAPVFLSAGSNACLPFNAASSSGETFVGFTSRAAVKAPDTYGSNEATYNSGDPVEVLVRGSIVLTFAYAVAPGESVYIRKADGALVTEAGAEGSTLLLPNVTVRTAADANNRAEVVLTKRNLM